jgi:hypothetical protein
MGIAKRVRKGRLVVICRLVLDIGTGRPALSCSRRTKCDLGWQLVLKRDEIPKLRFSIPVWLFEHFQIQHALLQW